MVAAVPSHGGRSALPWWSCAYKISLHIFHLPRPCPAENGCPTIFLCQALYPPFFSFLELTRIIIFTFQLVKKENVKGVITMNEDYETRYFVNTAEVSE
jgi:hypothetical protein